jgi:hypothetical protein
MTDSKVKSNSSSKYFPTAKFTGSNAQKLHTKAQQDGCHKDFLFVSVLPFPFFRCLCQQCVFVWFRREMCTVPYKICCLVAGL